MKTPTLNISNTPWWHVIIKWKHFPCYWPFVRGIHQWIPLTKASDAELSCFLWSAPEQTVEQTTVCHLFSNQSWNTTMNFTILKQGTETNSTFSPHVQKVHAIAKCTIRWPLSVSLMVKIFFHSWEYLLLLSINHMSQPHTDEILELNLVWFLFYDSFS